MFERFRRSRSDRVPRGYDTATEPGVDREPAAGGEPGLSRERTGELDRTGERGRGGLVAPETLQALRTRQRASFGGLAWGSAFFGWLTAAGLTAILAGILAAAGVALGLTDAGGDEVRGVTSLDEETGASNETIGLGGGILLLAVLALAYYAGGYVAGRMARFDGARQGVGVWLWGIIAAVVIALIALIGGSEYNVLDQLNLPRIPIDQGDLTTGGAIALAVALLVTLLAAMLGGKAGERYHRRVDRTALEDRPAMA